MNRPPVCCGSRSRIGSGLCTSTRSSRSCTRRRVCLVTAEGVNCECQLGTIAHAQHRLRLHCAKPESDPPTDLISYSAVQASRCRSCGSAKASRSLQPLPAPYVLHCPLRRCNTIQHGATQYANGATVQYCLDVRLPGSLAVSFRGAFRADRPDTSQLARLSACICPHLPSPCLACRRTHARSHAHPLSLRLRLRLLIGRFRPAERTSAGGRSLCCSR
jgi:hypothetical protein